MQAHFLRYSCEIFTTKTCYVENKNIRLSIEKMRKMMLVMLRMRMCCCRISGGGSSNRLFTTGGFIIVPPSYTITHTISISPLFHSSSLLLLSSASPLFLTYSLFIQHILYYFSSFMLSFMLSFSLYFILYFTLSFYSFSTYFIITSISSFRFSIISLIFIPFLHIYFPPLFFFYFLLIYL